LQVDDATCGLLRIFDLDDGTPLFDLRIGATHRGKGIGTAGVQWATRHVFDRYRAITRFEATTRVDNVAMRRALLRNGWVKESHWRCSWPSSTGEMVDGVGYGILRSDWSSGRTTPVAWES
jgi:RimJ/RimL family protein N-acetyltransferase